MPKTNNSIFKAIADPTRREIIALLAVAGVTLSITEISENFAVSRQAISKHLNVLQDAGLLTLKREGRETVCIPDMKPLQEVDEWISAYRKFWVSRLSSLERYLDKERPAES